VGDGEAEGSRPSLGVRPGTLSALLQEIASAPEVGSGAWEAALRPRAAIGKFELLREIGRGGFGVVWEARDRELNRSVAFKAVQAGGKARLREERLLREAEAAAGLSHPNIVTLFDMGRAEQGPYLVFELLRGQTLAARLAQGSLPVAEALRIAAEVAKGLAHAHGQGVVHRDLKPENVFLCEDGQVKILDFGLAHAFGHRRADGGTAGYMAPEQAEGAPEDERTDVFALGVVLFEMLTGKRPFPDEKALRSAGAAPALEVPGEPALGELIARMLEKRPVARPRDGGELLAPLAAFGRELGRAPGSASGPVRTRRRPGRRLAGMLAAGVAAGTLLAGGVAWWRSAGRLGAPSPAEPVTLAVLPLWNLSGDPSQDYLSDGMTEEIIGKLSRLAPLAVTARSSVARYKASAKSAREIGKELGVAYVLEGSFRRAGDQVRIGATLVKTDGAFQVWHETIDGKLDDVFEVQERVATRIVEALQVRLSPDEAGTLRRWGTGNPAAYDEYLRGQALVERIQVRESVEAAFGHFQRALQIDPAFAPAMVGLAFAEGTTYRNFDASPERLTRARALLDRALAIDPTLPRALTVSGLIRANAYDYRGAAEDFRRFTVVDARNHEGWNYLCWTLGYVIPPEAIEAERACRRALELEPSAVHVNYHLARALILQGRLAEAEERIDLLAKLSPDTPFVFWGRFFLHLYSNRPREALTFQEKAPQTANLRAWRSMALAQAGDLDGALAALEEALAKGYRDVAQLRGEPMMEPLRRDPRFARLLAKHGIDLGAAPEGRWPGPRR